MAVFGDVGRGRLSVDAGKVRLRLNEVCWFGSGEVRRGCDTLAEVG